MSKKKIKKQQENQNNLVKNLANQKMKTAMQDPVMSILFGMLPAEDKLRQQIETVLRNNE